MEFAEYEFRLGKSGVDGASERSHQEAADRQWAALGKPRKASPIVTGPPIPEELAYLWDDFHLVMAGVELGGMAPPVISWSVLFSWCALNEVDLEPWEAKALVMLSRLQAAISSEKK